MSKEASEVWGRAYGVERGTAGVVTRRQNLVATVGNGPAVSYIIHG